MNSDVLSAFGIFQFTFLLLDIYILARTSRDITRRDEHTWFCALIVTHIQYLICNTLWTFHEYDRLTLPRYALMLICTVSLWSVTNCATSFFLFVVERRMLTFFRTPLGRLIRRIPAFITTMLIISNPWTKLVFTFSPEGYFVHEVLYLPTLALAALYLLAVAVVAAVSAARTRTAFRRHADMALSGSVLLIILYIVVDSFFQKASILPAAVFAVIVVIFILMQESNINSDALTGMNNRRKADEYLSEQLTHVSPTHSLYLYLGDLNSFKKINDTYGHIEGDEALICCSRALKRTIGKYSGFAARFGGDEFLMAWQPEKTAFSETDPEALIRDLSALLTELSQDKPYQLAMTVGYVICDDPSIPLNERIKQADQMLYERKAALRIGR